MLEIIKAIIYGIVEGITEWLPISSTGHLILVERLIPFQETSEGFFDMFDVVIQLGAILAVVVLFWNKNRVPTTTTLSQLTYRDALIIGFCQLVAAALPGTSRSGATILGAIMIGISRTVAAEFTFFLAIPVMFGASLLKVLKFGFAFTGMELACLLVGTVISFIVSLFVLRFLMGYIKKHDFKVFGWYRIVLGIIVLLYFLVFA